jgi:hypothetical protein
VLSKDEELRRELDAAIERAKKGQRRKLQQPEREPPAHREKPLQADRLSTSDSEG